MIILFYFLSIRFHSFSPQSLKSILPPYVIVLPYQYLFMPTINQYPPSLSITLFSFIVEPCAISSPPLLEQCLFRLATLEQTVFVTGYQGCNDELIARD